MFAHRQTRSTVTPMLGKLWNDNRGHISEYALILSLILVLGIALISQTGKSLHHLYQTVAQHQSGSTQPR